MQWECIGTAWAEVVGIEWDFSCGPGSGFWKPWTTWMLLPARQEHCRRAGCVPAGPAALSLGLSRVAVLRLVDQCQALWGEGGRCTQEGRDPLDVRVKGEAKPRGPKFLARTAG